MVIWKHLSEKATINNIPGDNTVKKSSTMEARRPHVTGCWRTAHLLSHTQADDRGLVVYVSEQAGGHGAALNASRLARLLPFKPCLLLLPKSGGGDVLSMLGSGG